jgi:TM2 domain-containing membrane protein YozV
MKSKFVAYLLWFLLGVFSAHRFYLKKYDSAMFYLLTFQLLGLGWVFDAFLVGEMVERYNLKHGYYGPVKGIGQNAVVKIIKGNQSTQSSHEEHPAAS